MSQQNFKIRQGLTSDGLAIAEFNQRMALETEGLQLDKAVLEAGVKALLNDTSKGFYLVAEIGAELVGQLMITYEWSDWRNRNIWWIQSVYVRADFRRMGIYKALYEKVKMLASEQGAREIRLYVERENEVAQQVYRALGMDRSHYLLFEAKF